jgi:GcrA cell cycle regulator
LAVWTSEAIEQLRALVEEGLSATKIGLALGYTRNAVIGKLNRIRHEGVGETLRLKGRFGPQAKRDQSRPRRLPKPEPRPMVEEEKPMSPPPLRLVEHKPGRKTFFELGRYDCRWTDSNGHAGDFIFCGDETVLGRPYCAHHCLRAGDKYKSALSPKSTVVIKAL